jgi:hypothetical protein
MRIWDFECGHDATTPAEVESVLSKRHGAGINSFWMGHADGGFPAINIMVKGDLAYVHYFPQEHHPGLASIANFQGQAPEGSSAFLLSSGGEKAWVPNRALVPFSEALNVAKEFAISGTLPKCMRWKSL